MHKTAHFHGTEENNIQIKKGELKVIQQFGFQCT